MGVTCDNEMSFIMSGGNPNRQGFSTWLPIVKKDAALNSEQMELRRNNRWFDGQQLDVLELATTERPTLLHTWNGSINVRRNGAHFMHDEASIGTCLVGCYSAHQRSTRKLKQYKNKGRKQSERSKTFEAAKKIERKHERKIDIIPISK